MNKTFDFATLNAEMHATQDRIIDMLIAGCTPLTAAQIDACFDGDLGERGEALIGQLVHVELITFSSQIVPDGHIALNISAYADYVPNSSFIHVERASERRRHVMVTMTPEAAMARLHVLMLAHIDLSI